MGIREYFGQRVSGRQVAASLLGVAGLIAYSTLKAAGQEKLAWVVLVPIGAFIIGEYFVAFLRRRRSSGRYASLQEATVLPWAETVVWSLIKPAEKAPVLDSSIRRGYRVPGTPDGLGERQAFEKVDGTIEMIEVIGYVEGRRAVTRQIAPPPTAELMHCTQAIEPTGGGCVYTFGIDIKLPHGQHLNPDFERQWRINAKSHFTRIREVLAELSQVPAPPRTTSSNSAQPQTWPPPRA